MRQQMALRAIRNSPDDVDRSSGWRIALGGRRFKVDSHAAHLLGVFISTSTNFEFKKRPHSNLEMREQITL
jgi:hypothetical protein